MLIGIPRNPQTGAADTHVRCPVLEHRGVVGRLATQLANRLSHGRRQFVELADNFPEECRSVLETLGSVWHHDALARQQNLTPQERLRFHQCWKQHAAGRSM